MYTCHLMVIRRAVLEEIGGFRTGYEGAQDYDLLLRIVDRPANARRPCTTFRASCITGGSFHSRPRARVWPSRGLSMRGGSRSRITCDERAPTRTSCRVAHRDSIECGAAFATRRSSRSSSRRPVSPERPEAPPVDLLAQAIRSVVDKTVVRSLRADPCPEREPRRTRCSIRRARALEGTRHRVVSLERLGLFNFSASINAGVAAAEGEHLVLFNDDLEVISPDWLTAMLEYSQEPGVGAVGPKLLYPDGRLQHVGIVLGVAGVAAHAYHQHPGVSPGYGGSAILARNYSAVTGACLMTRKQVFEQVGRFDERLPTDFNDVDYCLRLRRAGYRIVYTPWAQLYHHESASFGSRQHDLGELGEMRQRWSPVIDNDPYYNPNLTRDFPDYRIDA